MKTVIAYTDGSAVVNGKMKGAGGFGAYFPNFYGNPKAFSAGYVDTKTGRMEISALYYAITAFYVNHKEDIELTVYSDSEYVVKTFTENRLERWIKEDFYGKKNVDMWKAIIKALEERPFLKLKMIHIKSHQYEKERNSIIRAKMLDNPHIVGNMLADKLADYKRHKKLLKSDKL